MNRKHNPFIAMTALVLLVTILVLACSGCGNTAAAADNPADRFVIEYGEYEGAVGYFHIVTDTETSAQYLLVYTHGGVGLTVLQDGEG